MFLAALVTSALSQFEVESPRREDLIVFAVVSIIVGVLAAVARRGQPTRRARAPPDVLAAFSTDRLAPFRPPLLVVTIRPAGRSPARRRSRALCNGHRVR